MRAYALIPARSGSKGLPDKNILPIGGHPLLAWSIAFARKIPVERVLLSTDSERYAEIGRSYGAECPSLRSAAASSDTAMEEDILADLDARLPPLGIPLPDIWVWLKPTCPFRDVAAVTQAIGLLRDRPDLDSVRIVSEADARLHRINAAGFLEPLLESWDPARSKMRRSEFPKVYQPFNLEVFRHAGWKARGGLFMGRRIHPIVLPRITGLDVDDRDGFELIRALIEKTPRPDLVANHLHTPEPAAAGRIAQVTEQLRAEPSPGAAAREVLARARFSLPAVRAAAERVLVEQPDNVSALRVLSKCQGRAEEYAAAAATLRRLTRLIKVSQETRRELGRLDLLSGVRPPGNPPAEEAMTPEPLAAASDAAMRALADGRRPDGAALGVALREAVSAALRAGDAPPPPAFMRLRRAGGVAIVGNGPSLAGSGQGAAIEAHDVVLRFNYPVLGGHEADVGRRTDVMMLAGAKRAFLRDLLAREPGYRRVPVMVTDHTPPAGEAPQPPAVPPAIMRAIRQACYAGPTTGLSGIVLTTLLLNRPATLYGFDFFRAGEPGHYFGDAAAALQHEIGFERWFVTRFLPAVRPGVTFAGKP